MRHKILFFALLPLVFATGVASDPPVSPSPAQRLIQRIRTGAGIVETPCATVPRLPPGAFLCGRVSGGDLGRAVHEAAFELAAEGVPLLRLESSTVPQIEMVDYPGFAPFERVEGLDVRGFLVDRSRVGVWIGAGHVVFTLENFEKTFPLNMPAAVAAGD